MWLVLSSEKKDVRAARDRKFGTKSGPTQGGAYSTGADTYFGTSINYK